MYGLLVENLAMYIRKTHGEGKWESIRRNAGVDSSNFPIHHVYAETLVPKLAKSAAEILGITERDVYEGMGSYFVEFVAQYGYDKILSLLGRHLRDFLMGLDTLHEYLRYTFPKIRAPSFFCDNESVEGMIIHYRSRRRAFIYYTLAQIRQVAKVFYDTIVDISLKDQKLEGDILHVQFDLKFDNWAFAHEETQMKFARDEQSMPLKSSILFELFPFSIVFGPDMIIKHMGFSLLALLKDLCGQWLNETFQLIRPNIIFNFEKILDRKNNVFEIETLAPIKVDEIIKDEDEGRSNLRLRGQMMYIDEWGMIMFLATPILPDMDSLIASGLYINDLCIHDSSRELVLAGSQQEVELKLALAQELTKGDKLVESMKKLDQERKRTDEILYQMIPKEIAQKLRDGINPADTCQIFESVSILYSDLVSFTKICSDLKPTQVVGMLNHMYSLFDQMTERNHCYKVETIGDAYMDHHHAEKICDLALDMLDAMTVLKNPTTGEKLKLRIGIHSGLVVAGVVGLKMPRYCLFGRSVVIANQMESSGEGDRVHISEDTNQFLSPTLYQVEKRGTVALKGIGDITSFWLNGREKRINLTKVKGSNIHWSEPKAPKFFSDKSAAGADDDTASIDSKSGFQAGGPPSVSSNSSRPLRAGKISFDESKGAFPVLKSSQSTVGSTA